MRCATGVRVRCMSYVQAADVQVGEASCDRQQAEGEADDEADEIESVHSYAVRCRAAFFVAG